MFRKPIVLITGANGWIGYNARQALAPHYQLILVDSRDVYNPGNRFGIEGIDPGAVITSSNDTFYKMDLASERKAFEDLVKSTKPDCVIHLAGVLENQSTAVIATNLSINQNVLESCVINHVPIIAASSIMVMYGAALNNRKIRTIFEKAAVEITPEEQLTVETSLQNTPDTIKLFNESCWEQNLAYINTKELLENLAASLTEKNSGTTIVAVRFGWTGIKNPYEIEGEGKITETPVYLDKADLQSFLKCLVASILTHNIDGFKRYICVSLHPQSWVDIRNVNKDIGWAPSVNIVKKFAPGLRQTEPDLASPHSFRM